MKIQILAEALDDLHQGFRFYEGQEAGLGAYFLEQLFSDVDSLLHCAGIHPRRFSYHCAFAKRFPFAIYYRANDDRVFVHAVLDCRRNPSWIGKRLKEGN
ncbi:MAG: type II toxin-antitoxin system RelE/ParE family toxin [Nitrospiraceae bacterium]